jgi:hypothetical protein
MAIEPLLVEVLADFDQPPGPVTFKEPPQLPPVALTVNGLADVTVPLGAFNVPAAKAGPAPITTATPATPVTNAAVSTRARFPLMM